MKIRIHIIMSYSSNHVLNYKFIFVCRNQNYLHHRTYPDREPFFSNYKLLPLEDKNLNEKDIQTSKEPKPITSEGVITSNSPAPSQSS